MAESVLEISGLTKNFGKIKAVDKLEMTVPKGSVFGILGPNGSGKSTTLGMVLGVVNPSSGSFQWFGKGSGHRLRKYIGAIIEAPSFYHYLSATQNLRVVAKIKDVPAQRIDGVLERVGLISRKDDPFKAFSLGMKQRLAIAAALLSDPQVMVLDEPTNGLDPQGIAEIRDLIIGLASEGRTIIIASHLLDEVQRVCTDFAVLRMGQKVFQGRVDELSRDKAHIRLNAPDQKQLENELNNHIMLDSWRKEGGHFTAVLNEGIDITDFHKSMIDKGLVLSRINQDENSLERKFLEILKEENYA